MRAIEDRDFSAGGRVRMNPPQKIVTCFNRGWLFETGDCTALRVHHTQNMPDRAVFASSVQALQDNQQTLPVFGIQTVLQCADLFSDVLGGLDRGFLRVVARGFTGVLAIDSRGFAVDP